MKVRLSEPTFGARSICTQMSISEIQIGEESELIDVEGGRANGLVEQYALLV